MYGKPLAYVVRIKEIREIPGADRIELASVMDYTVVVKKGEYQAGDLGIYVEVDSLLPDGLSDEMRDKYRAIKEGEIGAEWNDEQREHSIKAVQSLSKYPYFEFLRDKKFKIKSMKLSKFGVVSQGILFKPSDLTPDKLTETQVSIPAWKIVERADLTKELGITEIVQDEEEAGVSQSKRDCWLVKKLMRFKWFRDWRKRNNVQEIWDPSFPEKSDEENVQKIYTKMYQKYSLELWVATEKLEGQNISIYSEEVNGWFGKKTKRIGVCSRTRELNPKGNCHAFWDTVKRLGLDEKIKSIPGEWWCRGEHLGPGIQKNIYKLPRTEIRFFDFYQKQKDGTWRKLNYLESLEFSHKWDLPMVPLLNDSYKLPGSTVNDKGVKVSGADIMLQQSDGTTCFGNDLKHKREGFVLRLRNDYTVSFKVKNPNYSI